MDLEYIDKPLFQLMFGICVQEARESKGFSLARLGALTGISTARLQQIESGKAWAREATREKLMVALGISTAHEEKLVNVARVAFVDELMQMWRQADAVDCGL